MPKSSKSFTPDQLSAGADHALQVIRQAGNDAESLVDAWATSANAAAVQAVAELGDGPARKAARRALSVLKSRGVPIPSTARTGRVPAAEGNAREAWLLPPDGNGVEGVVLAVRQPSGTHHACFVFFRDGQNIVRGHSGQLAHSKIRENMQQALGNAGYGPVNVPWEWAQHRVVERRAWHTNRRVPEPFGLNALDKLLDGAPSEAPTHPFDEEGLALGDEDAEKLARDSAMLHQWPEFRSWLPSERAVQEMLFTLGRRLGPEPPTKKEELDPIVREVVAAATDRYFTPERRAVLARRMKDSGLSVLARLGETAALQVAAVVHVIRGAGLITNPPSDVRFLTAFFDKAIALLAARQGGQLRIPIPRPAIAPAAAGGEADAGQSSEESPADDASANDDPLAPEGTVTPEATAPPA